MPTVCIVPGCLTKQKQGLTFFSFTKSLKERDNWQKALNLTEVSSSASICELHFRPEQILIIGKQKRLKPCAVPSRHLQIIKQFSSGLELTPEEPNSLHFSSSSSSSSSAGYNPNQTMQLSSKIKSSTYLEIDDKRTFIVREEHFRKLFIFCNECGSRITESANFFAEGAHLHVTWFCNNCNTNRTWTNFSMCSGLSEGNILLPAAFILAGKTYADLVQISDGLNLQTTSKDTYYNTAKHYVYPSIDAIHAEENEKLLSEIALKQSAVDSHGLKIALDTRFSRPGFTATYATTSAMDLDTEKIIASVTTKKTVDAQYSQNLELEGTVAILNSLLSPYSSQSTPKKTSLRIDNLVTDEHKGIIKMVKADFPTVQHDGDVWHFVKRLKKRLSKLSENSATKDLALWIKSISNFTWAICQSCKGDQEKLVELWNSMLLHVSNQHAWPNDKNFMMVKKCPHDDYSMDQLKKTAWLKRGSKSYRALESVIGDKLLVNSLRRCSHFLQTSKVESFNSCILHFAPKRLSFGWDGYNSRIHLSVLHFNENIGRPIAFKDNGEFRTRSIVPLATGEWTMKIILDQQSYKWRQVIMKKIFQERQRKSAEGHRLRDKSIIMAPSLVSAIPRQRSETLLSNLQKRR